MNSDNCEFHRFAFYRIGDFVDVHSSLISHVEEDVICSHSLLSSLLVSEIPRLDIINLSGTFIQIGTLSHIVHVE